MISFAVANIDPWFIEIEYSVASDWKMNANTWELMYEASQTLYFSQLEDCNYFGILPYSVLYNKFHVSNKKNSGFLNLNKSFIVSEL